MLYMYIIYNSVNCVYMLMPFIIGMRSADECSSHVNICSDKLCGDLHCVADTKTIHQTQFYC